MKEWRNSRGQFIKGRPSDRVNAGKILKTFEERVKDKTKRLPNGCLVWISNRNKYRGDYGYVRVCGKAFYAHRFFYERYNGKIPNGMCVLHKCDNPPCVEPTHLWLGTYRDNAQDKVLKKRHPRKIQIEDHVEIKYLLEKEKLTHKDIGDIYNVSGNRITKTLGAIC